VSDGVAAAPVNSEDATGAMFRPWWFVAIAVGWTWAFWWSAAWSGSSWSDPLVFALFAAGGAGPLLAAVVLLRVSHRRQDARDFIRRLVDVRLPRARGWALVGVVALLPSVLGRVMTDGGTGPSLAPGAWLVLVTAVVAGLLEEPGWRGYLLEALSARHALLLSVGAVGAVWALWHLPLFFITGSYQHGLGLGSRDFWLFMSSLFCLSFVYAAVYLTTGRSILAVVLLHAGSNAAGELVSAPGARATETLVILAMSVVAVVVLARRSRHGLGGHRPAPGCGSDPASLSASRSTPTSTPNIDTASDPRGSSAGRP
jgi:uncharacterized protein